MILEKVYVKQFLKTKDPLVSFYKKIAELCGKDIVKDYTASCPNIFISEEDSKCLFDRVMQLGDGIELYWLNYSPAISNKLKKGQVKVTRKSFKKRSTK